MNFLWIYNDSSRGMAMDQYQFIHDEHPAIPAILMGTKGLITVFVIFIPTFPAFGVLP